MAFERISVDPARMRGLPCVRGTRVTVSAILGQLAAGQAVDQVLADYPQLTRDEPGPYGVNRRVGVLAGRGIIFTSNDAGDQAVLDPEGLRLGSWSPTQGA